MEKLKKQLSVIDNNIKQMDMGQTDFLERRLAHIQDLFRLLTNNSNTKQPFFLENSFRERYNSFTGKTSAPPVASDMPDCERASLMEYLGTFDGMYLCKIIMDAFFQSQNEVFPPYCFFTQVNRKAPKNKIAYLSNYYTDIAYSNFSKILYSPTVMYCDDFNGVCESVYYERSNSCILPISTTFDGRLMSFRNLIMKYDLKVTAVCSVSAQDDSNITKFALLKKNIEQLDFISNLKKGSYFEFNVIPTDGVTVNSLLTAASYFGLTLRKIDSMPVSYSENEYSYDIILSFDNAELSYYLCYLSLNARRFTPIGIYYEI